MLTVQPATGLKHELVMYMRPKGNASCDDCGALSTAAAPDWLLRERRGWIWNFALALARKRYHRRKEGLCMDQAHEYATKLAKLPDRIAAVVGKTYAVMGDAAWDEDRHLADNEALAMIVDLLEELDETIIERNKNKRLARR